MSSFIFYNFWSTFPVELIAPMARKDRLSEFQKALMTDDNEALIPNTGTATVGIHARIRASRLRSSAITTGLARASAEDSLQLEGSVHF